MIFGGSGAIGSAAARVLAREGARVFIGARNRDRLDRVAREIREAGGTAEAFTVDVLDESATTARVARIANGVDGIDISLSATGFMHDQGTGIDGLSLAEFMRPVNAFLPALFITLKAVVPHMGKRRTGVILTLTAPASRLAIPGHLAHIATSAAEEAFARVLASELGPRNIRALCLRSHAIADAIAAGSYTAELFARKAKAMGLTAGEWVAGAAASTMLGRLPTLSQVSETIAFPASNHANAMTATAVNMTSGLVED